MSPDSGPFVLIAALSGRALAAAARNAGYRPLVADLFADLDTQAIAAATLRVPGSLASGLSGRALLRAIERLADGRSPAGLVFGSGFERRRSLLHRLGKRQRLLGNSPKIVEQVADPTKFATLCRAADVAHPEIRRSAAPNGDWLEKRAGAAGGAHIHPVAAGEPPRRGHYLQRRAEGRPVSALFLANGSESRVLGFSEQWAAPLPGRPFRYGGAVRPAALSADMAAEMQRAIARLVALAGLVGLNSADFLARPDGLDLLEINPRPGATLDIFADAEPPLFEMHVQACAGRLPDGAPAFAGAAASAVVYVPRAGTLPIGFVWPDWAADRQPPGIPVPADGPLCTVLARADDALSARRIVRERIAVMLELAGVGR